MTENDFYVAIQGILDQASRSGWTNSQILQYTENALDEWYTEVIGDEEEED